MGRSTKLESGFQDKLVDVLKDMFPGCFVFKMDQKQGIPDLLILYGKKWATLETKRLPSSAKQLNQDFYVEHMNKMSFSRFINKTNMKEVLYDLQQSFEIKK